MLGVLEVKKILLIMCFAVIAAIGTQVGNMGAAEAADAYVTDIDGGGRMFVETETIHHQHGGQLSAKYKLVSRDGSSAVEYSIQAGMDEGQWWYGYVGSRKSYPVNQYPEMISLIVYCWEYLYREYPPEI